MNMYGLFGRKRQKKVERSSVDFVIDGVSLSSMLGHPDLVGMFTDCGHKNFGKGVFNQELRPSFLEVGISPKRINLYSTCLCGDPWCGAVTCEISRQEGRIVWAGLAHECGYIEERDSYTGIGPFEFDGMQYAEAIERAVRGETS